MGTCGAWGGCTLPPGHNMGKADIRSNHQIPQPVRLKYKHQMAMAAVRAERLSQERVWGEQHHADGTGGDHREIEDMIKALNDAAEIAGRQTWFRIALEEVIEVSTETDKNLLLAEVIQAAAVFVNWAEDLLDQKKRGLF